MSYMSYMSYIPAVMIVTRIPTPKNHIERAAWLTRANLVAFALSFFTPLVIVRVFDQAEFGTYKQMFLILTTFMTALYLQVPMSAYYFMRREPDKRAQVAMNIILFYLATGLLTALVFAAYPAWITYIFHNPALDEYTPLLGVALTLSLMAANIEIFPLAVGDVRTASRFIVLAQISKSLILICAAVIFGSLRAVLWGTVIQGVIQCALMLGYIHYRLGSLKVRPDQLFDWSLLKKQISNSLPQGDGGVAQSLRAELHNYFVSHYFSAASFAVYANGCFQPPPVSLLQSSFKDALAPEITRLEASGDYRAVVQAWLNAIRRLSLVILPACALMFVVRRELIVTLFTETYADSAQVFSIYLAVLLTQTALTSPIMLSVADFRRHRFKFNLAQIPLACAALYIGVKFGGVVGVCVAAVCLNSFEVAVSVIAIYRKFGVKRIDLKQLAPLAGVAPAVVMAMIASSALRILIATSHPIIIIGACAIVFAFIYAIAAFLFGAYPPEDQDAIYKQAQRLIRKLTSVEIPRPAAEPEPQKSGQLYLRAPFNPHTQARDFSPDCKARAVLQVLQDAGSAARIRRELQIDESLLSDWKEQFIKHASSIFEKEPAEATDNGRIAELERLVGRLRLELEGERVPELERLVGRLILELEESRREPAAMAAPAGGNQERERDGWDLYGP
jgi:O-antigen/teichoic acid export membrane protein/transposase-like protein